MLYALHAQSRAHVVHIWKHELTDDNVSGIISAWLGLPHCASRKLQLVSSIQTVEKRESGFGITQGSFILYAQCEHQFTQYANAILLVLMPGFATCFQCLGRDVKDLFFWRSPEGMFRFLWPISTRWFSENFDMLNVQSVATAFRIGKVNHLNNITTKTTIVCTVVFGGVWHYGSPGVIKLMVNSALNIHRGWPWRWQTSPMTVTSNDITDDLDV